MNICNFCKKELSNNEEYYHEECRNFEEYFYGIDKCCNMNKDIPGIIEGKVSYLDEFEGDLYYISYGRWDLNHKLIREYSIPTGLPKIPFIYFSVVGPMGGNELLNPYLIEKMCFILGIELTAEDIFGKEKLEYINKYVHEDKKTGVPIYGDHPDMFPLLHQQRAIKGRIHYVNARRQYKGESILFTNDIIITRDPVDHITAQMLYKFYEAYEIGKYIDRKREKSLFNIKYSDDKSLKLLDDPNFLLYQKNNADEFFRNIIYNSTKRPVETGLDWFIKNISDENKNGNYSLFANDFDLESIPEEIGMAMEFTNLKNIFLSRNKLRSLPESIGYFKKLSWLYLENNFLSSIPDSIGKLTNLNLLDLSNNQLTTLPDSFGNLKNLNFLNLSNNQLITLPDSFGQLENLEFLFLQNNQLLTLPDSICQLKKL